MARLFEIRDARGVVIGRLYVSDDQAAAMQRKFPDRLVTDITPAHMQTAPGRRNGH